MTYDALVRYFLIACMTVLSLTLLLCLLRAILGPRVSDRVVAINMAGTQTICMIVAAAVLLGEDGLADIALVYAFLSFLASVIITKIYTALYRGLSQRRSPGKTPQTTRDRIQRHMRKEEP